MRFILNPILQENLFKKKDYHVRLQQISCSSSAAHTLPVMQANLQPRKQFSFFCKQEAFSLFHLKLHSGLIHKSKCSAYVKSYNITILFTYCFHSLFLSLRAASFYSLAPGIFVSCEQVSRNFCLSRADL